MNVLVFIFNIDDFFILEQHQKVFVLFIYIHLNAIIFFNICLFLMCILIYLYFFNKKHFSFLDYTIITNLFFYYGFLICISGFF